LAAHHLNNSPSKPHPNPTTLAANNPNQTYDSI
jgi:hypothetical protein